MGVGATPSNLQDIFFGYPLFPFITSVALNTTCIFKKQWQQSKKGILKVWHLEVMTGPELHIYIWSK